MPSEDYYDTLFEAAQDGDTTYLALECLERALIDGADPNIRSHEDGETPLTLASQKAHLEIVKLLLETGKGADPDFPNAAGETALMLAAEHGHLEMVELLLERGANVNLSYYKMPALMWASCNGNVAMVKVLLKKGPIFT